jgi:signal transduction histidine kinase
LSGKVAAVVEGERVPLKAVLGCSQEPTVGSSPILSQAEDGVCELTAERLRRRLRRVALDLHDGPLQHLAAAGYRLVGLRGSLSGSSSELGGAVDDVLAQIGADLSALEGQLREVMASCRGAAGSARPLAEAIEHELDRFRAESSARLVARVEENVEADSESQRIALQSILREALTNVRKHSDARNVWVSLETTDRMVELVVEDDGQGFSMDDSAPVERFGLLGMGERAALLGGQVVVESRRGGPTVVRARLERWLQETAAGPGGDGSSAERAAAFEVALGASGGPTPAPPGPRWCPGV